MVSQNDAENFHKIACFQTKFPKFSMIQAKTYMLIFCWKQANFVKFFHSTWKTSINFAWNLQNLTAAAAILFYMTLYEPLNNFHANFSKYVQSNFRYGYNFFISRFFLIWPWKASYGTYVCNKVKFGNFNTRSLLLYGKKTILG